jgi:hypothetical protein
MTTRRTAAKVGASRIGNPKSIPEGRRRPRAESGWAFYLFNLRARARVRAAARATATATTATSTAKKTLMTTIATAKKTKRPVVYLQNLAHDLDCRKSSPITVCTSFSLIGAIKNQDSD